MDIYRMTLLLLVFSTSSNKGNVQLKNLNQIFTFVLGSVFEEHNCVFFSSNGDRLSEIVARVLFEQKDPVVHLNLNEITFNETTCNAYVLSVDHQQFTSTFSKKHVENFDVRRRTVAFVSSTEKVSTDTYTRAVGSRGARVFVVQVELEMCSDQLDVVPIGKHISVEIFDLFRRETISSTDTSSGLVIEPGTFDERLRVPDFNSPQELKVSTFNCPPYMELDSEGVPYNGIEYRILTHITQGWPIKYVTYFHLDTDTFYDAVNEDVKTGKSDIGTCSKWMDFLETDAQDTTYPYGHTCITFLVPKPVLLGNSSFVYQPMSTGLWLSSCGVLVSVSLFITFVLWCERKFGNEGNLASVEPSRNDGKTIIGFRVGQTEAVTDSATIWHDFVYSFLNTFRLFTLTGSSFPASSWYVLKLVVISWSLVCVVTSTGYSAGFSSILTSPRFYRQIDTVQDMVDYKIRWGEASDDIEKLFVNSTKKSYVELSKQFVLERGFGHRLELIRSNSYAFLVKSLPKRYISDTDSLDDYARTHLKVLSECTGNFYLVLPLKKNSPFKRMLDKEILRLSQYGFLNRWYLEARKKYPYMEQFYSMYVDPAPKTFSPFNLAKMQGALYILLAGFSLSCIVFIFEVRCRG